ncbi:MAG: OstA-like protein [Rikenellaceae bacterium]
MRRIISLAIVILLSWSLFDDVLFAQKSDTKVEQEAEQKVIDLTADIVYPMTLNDTVEVMCLVGNFAAQHNGAIITADSAVRYSDRRLECFGNVLINKNTTYAYAESADYNGELNEVNLYAPIVKVVDGEAVLYCYNFRFNTLDNVGTYEGGGVMINGESVMESITGYYFSDTKELIGVGDVELSGDEYQMKSDSIIYNTETESAIYFENTNIWNQKDEYLYADAGDYDKATDRYSFYLNGYILTEDQEIWSDSMDYFRASEHIYMRHNIQIDDTTQKSLIFGDFGEYIKDPGDMILVGRPSIVNYDAEQGDSLFMRADTFEIFTLNRFEKDDSLDTVSATELAAETIKELEHSAFNSADSLDSLHIHDHEHGHDHEHSQPQESLREQAQQDEQIVERDTTTNKTRPTPGGEMMGKGPGSGPRVGEGIGSNRELEATAQREIGRPTMEEESLKQSDTLAQDTLLLDSLSVDSLAVDSLAKAADTLNFWQRKKAQYLEARAKRQEARKVEYAARKVVLDSIGRARQVKINEKLDADKAREARRIASRKAKIATKKAQQVRRDVAKGKIAPEDTISIMLELAADSMEIVNLMAKQDSLDAAKAAAQAALDSLSMIEADSMIVDSLPTDSLALDSLNVADSVKVDSLYKLTKGYRNVKIYRSDFQAVADSMSTSSIDSIIRLYLDPILWQEKNQVTSDVMDIYTANNQISKAIFTEGTPIMASEIEQGVYYNQIAGKVITSLFANGEAYRNNVDGNAQTIYFMQDDDTGEVNGMMVMDSGSATFYIEDQTVVGITYRGEPNYTIYPMDLIPADQSTSLKGFTWQAERRPAQADVFDRIIRPTIRSEMKSVPRPQFPIHEELDALRKELIEDRLWIDRVDVVNAKAEEWMESLGYKTGQPREEQKEE